MATSKPRKITPNSPLLDRTFTIGSSSASLLLEGDRIGFSRIGRSRHVLVEVSRNGNVVALGRGVIAGNGAIAVSFACKAGPKTITLAELLATGVKRGETIDLEFDVSHQRGEQQNPNQGGGTGSTGGGTGGGSGSGSGSGSGEGDGDGEDEEP